MFSSPRVPGTLGCEIQPQHPGGGQSDCLFLTVWHTLCSSVSICFCCVWEDLFLCVTKTISDFRHYMSENGHHYTLVNNLHLVGPCFLSLQILNLLMQAPARTYFRPRLSNLSLSQTLPAGYLWRQLLYHRQNFNTYCFPHSGLSNCHWLYTGRMTEPLPTAKIWPSCTGNIMMSTTPFTLGKNRLTNN